MGGDGGWVGGEAAYCQSLALKILLEHVPFRHVPALSPMHGQADGWSNKWLVKLRHVPTLCAMHPATHAHTGAGCVSGGLVCVCVCSWVVWRVGGWVGGWLGGWVVGWLGG